MSSDERVETIRELFSTDAFQALDNPRRLVLEILDAYDEQRARAQCAERDNERLRDWLSVAHDMIGDWLVDADAYHSLTDPSEEWLQALRAALTAAADENHDEASPNKV